MIQMRMSQDDGIDFARGDGQLFPVAFAPFLLSLKKPAVDKNLESLVPIGVERGVDQMFGPGHRTGRAEKLDVSQTFLPDFL